ncbi:hypothetical protein A3D66_02130 [Candidatus Kaiserbacteria bacterium RIFCSPHIGHO2_02_FULL_50_9]|uniref:GtrA/DPMS transmembrane domain-containing protein n=1 Tax=Candidatus Kaiserbacteria bacterium RIFCSPLOWO2_01_FULL_51_21 TaxID=1798508 RepID=A0A1F6EE90_9BACT|nr:MAG: hypothetical protein A2761_02900 [Candidatus Kaiserbacteria bacterium RIFCSPHIGHO2_01_FULL_51_33]OGG63402.1 MAG: hypothetical protein A3D66_02130 [Candidatus Kaiserbacteria bacterium RIFCSPHIGHO2_02_FULL_50_9]OGG71937.1 MAG: hypothetical protein A3A35_02475 [Candidatus Kaiserbacteria bacterium RIFCSPLOWO2_01_FULL_51_21]
MSEPLFEHDTAIASLMGVVIGILALVPLAAVGARLTFLYDLAIVGCIGVGISAGFLGCKLAAERAPLLVEIARFCLVGALNTLLELVIINILIVATGVADGLYFVAFKTFSFSVGVASSYIYNKRWTFASTTSSGAVEFGRFAVVSVTGLFLNVGTAVFLVNGIGAPILINKLLWANIAVIIAVLVAATWNYVSQKYIIFRSPKRADTLHL